MGRLVITERPNDTGEAIEYDTAGLLIGWFRGFPGERALVLRNAKKYVIETYGLTPTEIEIVNFILGYPVKVYFETEEDDFWFHVQMPRFGYIKSRINDNYVEKLAEYTLAKYVQVLGRVAIGF